ncbi:Acyltransferase chloroplastic [Micractinium conductrix]|uniref:Acyltransferase chloroplastic n=1 Tax=Micractinium conductrix TaxID=554055 RepID=A0A2P6V1X8_9CHLO|nr:Acyltransferase chloroplastic [Micractinium conductrix]|eukprot:PSC68099.1 Acyltransferase chloroplastic [Micractinium conductrix]
MLSLATSKHHAGPSSSAPPGQRHRLATGRARRRPVLAAAAADAPSSSASEPSSSSSSSCSGVSIDASSAAVAPPAGNSTAPRRAAAAPVRMSLRSFVDMDDGGPPRVTSLLDPGAASLADGAAPVDRQHLPLMLYLPGIDGSGLAAARQFPSLLRSFDLRTLVTPPLDRTPFEGLVQIAADFLRAEVPTLPPTRPVYVLGESFGGVLALALAAEVPALVDRLVLVNPATSFKDSLWPVLGPLLPQVPAELYRALPLALAPVLGNPINLLAAGLEGSAGAGLQQMGEQLVGTATNLLQQLPVLAEILPAETLAWKLDLLRQGSVAVEPLLPNIQQRVFLLVGDQDLLIPSKEEGPRLKRALPRAQLRVERGRSHALLQEGGVDLASILEEEGFYVRERCMSAPISKRTATSFGVAAPVELPTPKEVQRYAEQATAFGRRLASPVFISTAPGGARCLGLSQIPVGRPLLLVGNHQTLALDLGVLTEQFLKEQGVLLRGLAHPAIFSQSFGGSGGGSSGSDSEDEQRSGSEGSSSTTSGSGSGRSSGLPAWDPIQGFGDLLSGGGPSFNPLRSLLGSRGEGGGSGSSDGNASRSSASATDGRSAFREFMTTFGAVPVSGFNMHRLLASGEAVLLFPGGVREAYKRRGEDYQLFWPEKSEFIRMAARFGATIVPFAAVGVDDSLNIIADSTQLEALPVVGDALRRRAGSMPQARRGVSAASAEEESFVAPLAAPRLPPGRMYFLFQEPIQTTPEDVKDRARCDELYRQTKASVQEGLGWLLEQRQRDPYRDFLPRLAREAAYPGQQAPTFPVNP